MDRFRRILELGAMTAMTPILAIPRADPDIPCAEPGCRVLAAYLTAGCMDEDGDPVVIGYCAEHLPGDENAGAKHLPPLALAGAVGRG